MKKMGEIVTVGLCPSWDLVCRFEGIEWGEHKQADSVTCRPAGKAMNISRALAWMGQQNTAAGLWGRDDYEQMKKAMRGLRGQVTVKMTAVEGATRRNVTVVDTVGDREMHLRFPCGLVSREALRRLRDDLKTIVKSGSVCVFAGMMPGSDFLDELVWIVRDRSERGAKIVVDTYGEALRRIVDAGLAWMIKPNVDELRELLGEYVPDRPASLATAALRLLDKIKIILISRGKNGAVVVTPQGAWQGRCRGRGRVLSTVGCGDYLLGGFLKGWRQTPNPGSALSLALKAATARAWGWTEEKAWTAARRQVRIEVGRV